MARNARQISMWNRCAWDELYGSTKRLIWGEHPAGFVEELCGGLQGSLASQARILDAGTGEGRNLGALLRLGGELHACDSSYHALDKIPAAHRARVRLQRCDLSRLAYHAEVFDLALTVDVIETLPEPEQALRELYRVLKTSGRLLCNIPGEDDGIAQADMTPIGPHRYLYEQTYFYQFLSEAEAAELLERSGFRIREVRTFTWSEDAHPHFRLEEHVHTSRVFVAVKSV